MTEEMREVFGQMLVELGRENPDIFVLDADLNTSTRTILFAEEFPKRFIQCGVAEQNMMGIAAGLATAGCIPFPTTFAVFATKRACDQVSISIAYPKLNVKIPGSYPGLPVAKAGATHQSVQDLAIMRAMPNMRVVDPGDNEELRQVMRAAVEYVGPVYFRVSRPAVADLLWPQGYSFRWGKAVTLREGTDIALIGTGFMTGRCLRAAAALAEKGISARVDHHPCLKPFDREAVADAARQCGAIVTAENHSIIGGLGGAVAETLVELCPVPMQRIGVKDRFVETGEVADLFTKYQTRVEDIVSAAETALRMKETGESKGV
ncbi:MAG: transketolase family protein [Anaerolineae bacterium]